MWDLGFVTLINETLGDEDLRRSAAELLPRTKFEVMGAFELDTVEAHPPAGLVFTEWAATMGDTEPGMAAPIEGIWGGTAADIMAMMPMPGAGLGTATPLGLRLVLMPLIAMPMPTIKNVEKMSWLITGREHLTEASFDVSKKERLRFWHQQKMYSWEEE